mgnify:FL=1
MNRCSGCGVLTENNLCERCFRIKHYNDYKVVTKSNDDFIPILNDINQSNDLVILVVDLFNLDDLSLIRKYIKNDILLVLTKKDLFPKSVSLSKFDNYDYQIDFIDKLVISSNKNYNLDELWDKINKYRKSDKVYVVGFTNAGKSTMINKLIYNYSDNKTEITTSPLPSTTLNTIEINLGDFILVDTPGFLSEGDISNFVAGDELKKIIPKKEIKPITYQIKGCQTIVVDKYLVVEAEDIDLTFYLSNNLKIERYYKKVNTDLKKNVVSVDHNDIVVKGLCFIKTNKKSVLNVYTLKDVKVFTRKSMI